MSRRIYKDKSSDFEQKKKNGNEFIQEEGQEEKESGQELI